MRILAALFTLLALSAKATPTTDFSDLWFNPDQEGWGVTITQQNETLFITLFVYDASNNPKWYVGPATVLVGSSGGSLVFSGPLYETKGPYLGNPNYVESSVQVIQAGQVTFAAAQISNATLTYNVGGVNVSKAIQRQTWAYERIAGVYYGATIGTFTGCGTSQDGYFESPATFTVNHVPPATAITIQEQGSNYTCTYTGNYEQNGRMGSIQGTGSCVPQNGNQAFIATEVQGGVQGLSMRYGVTFAGNCGATGRMGGMRKGN